MNEGFAYICISMHCVHVVPVGSEVGVRSLGCGITEGCELPCGSRESTRGPMGERPALLTFEPSLALASIF